MKANRIGLVLAVSLVAASGSGAARAEADAAHGQAIFMRTCAACHSTEVGVNKVGPSLAGVVGRPVASVADYVYSDKLKSMRGNWGTWDATRLDSYLINPRGVLHGVKMYFKGLPDPQDRADVIAYLKTLK